MKKIIKVTLLSSTLLLLLGGCGNDHNDYIPPTPDETKSLKKGDTVEINRGDKVEPSSADMKIKLTHTLDKSSKYLTVLEGTGTLIRGNYTNN